MPLTTASTSSAGTSRAARQSAITALLVAATVSRLIPHAPNFTAVPAVALLGGVLFGRSWLAFAVPLIAMALSDLALGALVYGFGAFQWMLPVYSCITCTVLIGCFTPRRPLPVVVSAALATATFFFVTNFFVWTGSSFYPPTGAGLVACYAAALPFAANMLLSSVAFSLGLLAVWTLLERRLPKLAQAR